MPPSLGHIKQKAVFPMETMKTASVSACYSSIMLKVTVMAVAAPFYGKKESALQPYLKDLFLKISPRRPDIPCTKPEQTEFCIHPSSCCNAKKYETGLCFTSSDVLHGHGYALPTCVVRKSPLDFFWHVSSGCWWLCQFISMPAKPVLRQPYFNSWDHRRKM